MAEDEDGPFRGHRSIQITELDANTNQFVLCLCDTSFLADLVLW